MFSIQINPFKFNMAAGASKYLKLHVLLIFSYYFLANKVFLLVFIMCLEPVKYQNIV